MTNTRTLTWRRAAPGEHLAQDGDVTYIAWRAETAPPGRQWALTATASPGRDRQTRKGFDRLFTAKGAALATRCHLCTRHRPFATMESSGGSDGWRCRDHEDCARAEAERNAEMRSIAAEIRNTPWAGVSIRDSGDGPELVVQTDNHNQTVVRATEPDLIRLAIVLLERIGDRARAALGEPPA